VTGVSVVEGALRRLWAARRGVLELFLGVLLPLGLFAALASEVVSRRQPWWDTALLKWIHTWATPVFDRTMRWISRLGVWYGVIPFTVLFLLWLLARRRIQQALFFLLSMAGAGLLNNLTKELFGRVRPALWRTPKLHESFSFPSGHAMGSMALAASLGVLAWRTPLRWPVVVAGAAFTVLVSGSRLYLGVHYPTDVLAAWAASLAWVLGLRHVLARVQPSPLPTADPAPASGTPAPPT
jgi:membrane-associated phospholipid phosphatase